MICVPVIIYLGCVWSATLKNCGWKAGRAAIFVTPDDILIASHYHTLVCQLCYLDQNAGALIRLALQLSKDKVCWQAELIPLNSWGWQNKIRCLVGSVVLDSQLKHLLCVRHLYICPRGLSMQEGFPIWRSHGVVKTQGHALKLAITMEYWQWKCSYLWWRGVDKHIESHCCATYCHHSRAPIKAPYPVWSKRVTTSMKSNT